MNSNELYQIWAPDDSLWSPWAKPVLFADQSSSPGAPEPPNWRQFSTPWVSQVGRDSAIVLDLPDALAVWFGLAMANQGYRPVPLYNGTNNLSALIPVGGIAAALRHGAEELAAMAITADAPPAFLLDERRTGKHRSARPGTFDNRWAVFPQDFPSGKLLRFRGINSAVLVTESGSAPQTDLAHVFLRWQEAGVSIHAVNRHSSDRIIPIRVGRPSGFRTLWQRALVLAGLRRTARADSAQWFPR
ncbi:MAG TPA: hypothetical protein VEH04_17510 [Verrucomicrobiae bacterium]|nr:hypothetical protein [Verrucomicrobiae bacterium]